MNVCVNKRYCYTYPLNHFQTSVIPNGMLLGDNVLMLYSHEQFSFSISVAYAPLLMLPELLLA